MNDYKKLKVIILAGGFGSRLDNITKVLPKPLVTIGNEPMILHIIKIFVKQGLTNFYLATGYKSKKFLDFFGKKSVVKIKKNKFSFSTKIEIKVFNKICNINLFYTGTDTMTGGRVKAIANNINDEFFFLTYGDGLANVNIKKLFNFHLKNKKLVTITAVNPPPRFGEVCIKNNVVTNFSEKKPIKNAWINGGFFIINKRFIKFIKNKNSILEREPLEKAVKNKQLSAYKHSGFWQCMDTRRDRDSLISLVENNKFPWLHIK